MAKVDESLFEDVKYEEPSQSKMDDALFEDVPIEEESVPSEIESALLGGVQGAAFDFADEAEAGVRSLWEAATKGKNVSQAYKDLIEPIRERYKKAEETNPASYMAGDIVAGLGTGLLTGGAGAVANLGKVGAKQGLKELAKMGAKQGAARGLGGSEGESIGEMAADTALGATVGGVAAPALGAAAKYGAPLLKKGASKLGETALDVADTAADKIAPNLRKLAKESYALSKEGVELIGEEANEQLRKDTLSTAEELLKTFRDQHSKGSRMVGSALKNSEQGAMKVANDLKKLEAGLNNANMNADDLDKIQKTLNAFKENVDVQTLQKTGMQEALDRMDGKLLRIKDTAEQTGSLVSIEDPVIIGEGANRQLRRNIIKPKGDELIGSSKSEIEGTGYQKGIELMGQKISKVEAEARELGRNIKVSKPFFDEESSTFISKVDRLNDKGEVVSSKTISQKLPKDEVVNVPEFADNRVIEQIYENIPEDQIAVETFQRFKQLNLQDLQNMKAQLQDLAYDTNIGNYAKGKASEMSRAVNDLIESKMNPNFQSVYDRGNELMSKTHKASNLLKELDPSRKFESDVAIPLAQKISKTNDKSENILEALGGYIDDQNNPILEDIRQIGSRQDIRRALNAEGGLMGNMFNTKGMAVRGGALAGKLSRTPAQVANKLSKINEQQLARITQAMDSSDRPEVQDLSRRLRNAFSDVSKKDRLVWALSQQPAFRDALRDYITDEEFDALEE